MNNNKSSHRCPYCGSEAERDAQFCGACGRILKESGGAPHYAKSPFQKAEKRPAFFTYAIIALFVLLLCAGGWYYLHNLHGSEKAAVQERALDAESEKQTKMEPSELFKDLNTLPFSELKKKYKLTSIPQNVSSEAGYPNFGMATLSVVDLVIHQFVIEDYHVGLLYQYPIKDYNGSDDSETAQQKREWSFDHVPEDATPSCFTGKCKDFLTNMPSKMTQEDYVKHLSPSSASQCHSNNHTPIWESVKYSDHFRSVTFAKTVTGEGSDKDPITPESPIGFR